MTSKKFIFKENKPTSGEELAVFGRVKHIFKEEERVLNVLQLIIYAMGVMVALLGIAMISVMLTGCSIIDEDTSDCPKDSVSAGSRSGSAIAFSVGDSTACTKGTVLSVSSTRTAEGTMTLDGAGGTESLKEKGFGVFACHTGVHPYISTSTTSNLLYNQQVAWNDGLGTWSYSPIVYWPNGDDGADQLVTFFAYGPHSDNAGDCIVDMSRPDDTGDPWLTYQLGGTENDWKTRQVDLIYDFKKDQKRDQNIATRIAFSFKHALACVGDELTVTAGPRLQRLLKKYALAMGIDITLTLKTLTLDYQLTRKGRLILNSSTQPNWQAVESEDAKVHRYVQLSPNHTLATSTSSVCTVNDYSVDGQGIFYIPIEVGEGSQQITVTSTWQMTNGDEGEVSTTVDLSRISEPSQRNNIHLSLELPEPECTGVALSNAEVGMIICEHGRAHVATAGELACEGKKVAVVAYVGDGDTDDDTYDHGLAIALNDAGQTQWCTQDSEACLGIQTTSLGSALSFLNGLTSTQSLTDEGGHIHGAATTAASYQYDAGVAAGAHPVGTSQWFLPSVGQWNLMAKALTGHDEGLTDSENADYKAAAINPVITAVGGTGVLGGSDQLYWTSTESSASNAWYMSFEKGKTSKTGKTVSYYVRPVLAF